MDTSIETAEQYLQKMKRRYKIHCEQEGIVIDIGTWKDLVAQWRFEYEMERSFGQVGRIEN